MQNLAGTMVELLGPGCERIEVAGSIRRQKEMIGDIEIVCIPHMKPLTDLFGDIVGYRSVLDTVLTDLAWYRTLDGPKQKQFDIDGTQLDLFICTPDTWAVTLLLRTGSREFSHRFVTPKRHSGMMPHGWRIHDSRLWHGKEPQVIREEPEVFEAIGAAWVEPIERVK
jgi:DNA polymerase/3'-5' exonuclease PolX